jgi:hypothetical protein
MRRKLSVVNTSPVVLVRDRKFTYRLTLKVRSHKRIIWHCKTGNLNYYKCVYSQGVFLLTLVLRGVKSYGPFTRPISEDDFALSYCLFQNMNIYLFLKMRWLNAIVDSHVNKPRLPMLTLEHLQSL